MLMYSEDRDVVYQLVCIVVSFGIYRRINASSTIVISPSEKTLPARLNMEIITRLQNDIAPDVFTPRAAYDGRKNLYAARELPFPEGAVSHEVYQQPNPRAYPLTGFYRSINSSAAPTRVVRRKRSPCG